jgi:hypothetical protein
MSISVPSMFHRPTSPVRSQLALVIGVVAQVVALVVPADNGGAVDSPSGSSFIEMYPASGTSADLISIDGDGRPMQLYCSISGGKMVRMPYVSVMS